MMTYHGYTPEHRPCQEKNLTGFLARSIGRVMNAVLEAPVKAAPCAICLKAVRVRYLNERHQRVCRACWLTVPV